MGGVRLVSIGAAVFALGVSTVGLVATGLIGVLIFAALVSLLIYHQEHVLYIPVVMGYKTVSDNPEGYRSPAEWGAEHTEFTIPTRDKESIHGWHIVAESPIATVIFCHENAGNIGLRVNNLVAMCRHLNVNVVAFDYRGYGSSSGTPSEKGLMIDTETVFNHVVETYKPENIFIYGRSLGGAVALQFASKCESLLLKGVVAENTFTSISAMVGSLFPFLNLGIVKKYFLRLKWETDQVVEKIKCPLLLISGLRDELVPPSHMAELHKKCLAHNLKVRFAPVPKGMHNDTWVVGGQEYWKQQRSFVQENITLSSLK